MLNYDVHIQILYNVLIGSADNTIRKGMTIAHDIN